MSNEDLGTVLYETTGPIATITMNRPEARNAQNTALIDDLDRAFDLAEADDDVRVVILAGAGDHFSAGHDLKALRQRVGGVTSGGRMRATAEGKLRHEQVMYYDKCMRIHDFRKPTIAQVQGACVAAGLMLAAMCDLIVAADDAFFSNPVAAHERRRGGAPRRAV
jgi:enoyl-CoA hydratase